MLKRVFYFGIEAIINNKLPEFKYVLDNGFDLYKRDSEGKFPITFAAKHNSIEIIRYVAEVLKKI